MASALVVKALAGASIVADHWMRPIGHIGEPQDLERQLLLA